jgi:acetyltransferase-like isoleucine patch superfamily enzyme
MAGATVGRNCNIGSHCFVETGASVGDNATIKNGNAIWEGVTIGDGVFVGPSVTFTNDRYPRSARLAEAGPRHARTAGWLEETFVERGATLGAGSILLPGIRIGEFAMVAAGALVTAEVPANALVVGSPAEIRGWVCVCGRPLSFVGDGATCSDCGFRYRLDPESPKLIRES